jgi:hypothetical protein
MDTEDGIGNPATPLVRTRGWALVGLTLLILLALFYVFGAVNDLRGAAGGGLPVDHEGTFTALAGTSFAHTQATSPGVASYVTLLERGYALHELTFALLFIVLLMMPFRRRQRWAWWAAWIPMIANLGYTLTFGAHDATALDRSVIADITLPVLLLAHIPAFFPRGPRETSTAG